MPQVGVGLTLVSQAILAVRLVSEEHLLRFSSLQPMQVLPCPCCLLSGTDLGVIGA